MAELQQRARGPGTESNKSAHLLCVLFYNLFSGNLFECAGDLEDPLMWQNSSNEPEVQEQSRIKVHIYYVFYFIICFQEICLNVLVIWRTL